MKSYMDVLDEVQKEFPDFSIQEKSKSLFMKVIYYCFLFFFVHDFMTNFITTIGHTMYVPDAWYNGKYSDGSKAEILRHERVHLLQQKRYGGFLFAVMYLFLPLPFGLAWCRASFEWEAYCESMRAMKEEFGVQCLKNTVVKTFFINHFTTSQYLWMWPFKGQVSKWYDDQVAKLESEDAVQK
jgi:hypothetical protein